MESEIEIITVEKKSYKKIVITTISVLLLFLLCFFGYRAYSFTKKIIVGKSSSASPYLTGGDLSSADISKLESGDRRINILLLGMGGENHPGGNLTDTIQVISIDPKNKSVAMLSVPRDLYIKVDGFGSYKINSVYSLSSSGAYDIKPDSEKSSAQKESDTNQHMDLMKKTISGVLGVPIHYAVVVNFDGFKKVIDILGGVDVDVKKDLYDPLYPDKYVDGYDELFIKAGQQHMDGETALKYARSRETTSDFDRSARQQEIMIAAKDSALKNISINKISQIMSILSDNLKTDLQLSEIEALANISKEIKSENIKTKVLDDSPDGLLYADKYDEAYVLVPNDSTFGELHAFASQFFKDPLIAEENAKILITDGANKEYYVKKLSDTLKSFGYSVDLGESTEKKTYSKTFIYDYSNNSKKGTLEFLKKYLGDVTVVTLDEKNDKGDIEIVIGSNYNGSIIK